ncbi:MAG: GumC family protein [candidate division NC10 bacterium]|nr:GumC family protein [candidate division NC10 bacterium]
MALPLKGEETHLRDYLRVLHKRRWLALGTFSAVVVGTVIWTFAQTPVYEGAVKVLIDREPPRVVNIQEVQPNDSSSLDYYQTQYEIIKSRPVIARAIESQGLVRRMPRLAKANDPVASLLRVVKVEPKRNTRLVDIKVQDPDPQLAADVANGIAKAYARYNLESKLLSTREALVWLSENMNELKAKVQDSEVALQKYREKAGIVGMEQQRNITGQKMMDLNRAFLEAQAQRLAVESRLKELAPLVKGNVQSGLLLTSKDNPLLQKLIADYSNLEVDLSKALRTYKEKHPEVLKIQSQMDQVQERMRAEIQAALKSVEAEYRVAKGREDSLAGRIEQVKREALDLNDKEIQYSALSRETSSNQQLYDVVLKRVKETGLSGGLETNNIRIVEDALVPNVPVRPRPLLNIALALVVGVMLGAGLAFFLEYFDNTIKTPEEVERYLGLTTLGVVPLFVPRKA